MFGRGAHHLSQHDYGNRTRKRGKSRQKAASTILGGFQLRKRPIMGPQMLQHRSKNGVECWVWFDSAAPDPRKWLGEENGVLSPPPLTARDPTKKKNRLWVNPQTRDKGSED